MDRPQAAGYKLCKLAQRFNALTFPGLSTMPTTVAHRTHAMRSAEATTYVTHRMHAMRSAKTGSKARAVTNTPCSRHLGSVAPANVCGALAMDGCGGLAVNRAGVLRMHGGLA